MLMDDYAKMWLQLAFPLYLIMIAASLIIASRYSTRIQRLTACRALPVLATPFLLSYSKLRAMSCDHLSSADTTSSVRTQGCTKNCFCLGSEESNDMYIKSKLKTINHSYTFHCTTSSLNINTCIEVLHHHKLLVCIYVDDILYF